MIRKAQLKDIKDIDRLLYQVHEIHALSRPDLFKKDAKKYNDEELAQIMQDSNRPIFVYEDNNKVLGYAFCVISNHANSASLVNYKNLYIDDLCVDSSARGQGIGKKIYEVVLSYAKSINCYNVTLNVWAKNEKALKFYQSIGMDVQKIGMEKIL